jgi:hypothetical protein
MYPAKSWRQFEDRTHEGPAGLLFLPDQRSLSLADAFVQDAIALHPKLN